MANMRREESKYEKLELEQREREQMRQAVAAYASPIIKCPPFRTNRPERQAPRPTALTATECRRPVAHQLADHHKGSILSLRVVIDQCPLVHWLHSDRLWQLC
jgi:hypothetical protein